MALCGHTGKEVVRVADRRGSHRAHQLASTLTHWPEQLRWPLLPAPCGHHRNPLEGFWRVLKDRIGAGRCFPDLQQLYQRTRRVLTEHQGRPIYAFHWSPIPPRTLWELLYWKSVPYLVPSSGISTAFMIRWMIMIISF